MKNSKRKRSVPHAIAKPATPITAFFKPVPTTTVFIPFTVPNPNHHLPHIHSTLLQLTNTDLKKQEENKTVEEVS
jgi:hypothetical protein